MSKTILLFPGGFKPFHDGHLSILESHIFNIDKVFIDEVHLYISYKNRDNITADSSLWFLNNIKSKLNKFYNTNIIPQISDIPSPIGKCYNDVSSNLNNDKFCIVSSNKGNDIERKKSFVNSYAIGGKYYKEDKGEQTVFINANIEPTYYTDRYDEFNNNPISSTIVRKDIDEQNYKNFRTSYEYMLSNNIVDEELLQEYYKKLIKLNNNTQNYKINLIY